MVQLKQQIKGRNDFYQNIVPGIIDINVLDVVNAKIHF